MSAVAVLAFNGVTVRDRGEMLSLTDMWKAAGSDRARKPAEWLRQDATLQFCDYLRETVAQAHLLSTTTGRSGATFAHWQIALAYAKYLSPEFHAACNAIVRERMARRPPTEEALPAAHSTPSTFAQALRLAADQAETLEQQQGQIAQLEPKALALVRLGSTPGAFTITAAAKLLKIKRSELIHMLQERRVIYRRPGPRGEWLGYSDREDAGWVEHTHTTVQGRDGRDKAVAQVRLTPKLITKIAERLVVQAEAA